MKRPLSPVILEYYDLERRVEGFTVQLVHGGLVIVNDSKAVVLEQESELSLGWGIVCQTVDARRYPAVVLHPRLIRSEPPGGRRLCGLVALRKVSREFLLACISLQSVRAGVKPFVPVLFPFIHLPGQIQALQPQASKMVKNMIQGLGTHYSRARPSATHPPIVLRVIAQTDRDMLQVVEKSAIIVARLASSEVDGSSIHQLLRILKENNIPLSIEADYGFEGRLVGCRQAVDSVTGDGETVQKDFTHHGASFTADTHQLAHRLSFLP